MPIHEAGTGLVEVAIVHGDRIDIRTPRSENVPVGS